MNEIMTLINSTLALMDQIENHIFTNHRAKYAGSKVMFDNYREEIEDIRRMLTSELSEAQLTELKNELASMTQNTNDARESGIVAPLANFQSFDTTIGTMITQLDNNTPETVLPTANIDIQAMENAIPNMDVQPQVAPVAQMAQVNPTVQVAPTAPVAQPETATVQPMPATPEITLMENGQDVIPQVEQVIIQEAPANEVVYEATPAPQILDSVQSEVVQTVTPDIVITSGEPEQMASIAPTIEIPNVEPMIQVPNVEIPTNIGIPDTNQEAGA